MPVDNKRQNKFKLIDMVLSELNMGHEDWDFSNNLMILTSKNLTVLLRKIQSIKSMQIKEVKE